MFICNWHWSSFNCSLWLFSSWWLVLNIKYNIKGVFCSAWPQLVLWRWVQWTRVSRREACSGCQCCMDLGQGWSCVMWCCSYVVIIVKLKSYLLYAAHTLLSSSGPTFCDAANTLSLLSSSGPTFCEAVHMLSLLSSSGPTSCDADQTLSLLLSSSPTFCDAVHMLSLLSSSSPTFCDAAHTMSLL